MQLKEELTLIQRGHLSFIEYLHVVKTLTDEIAIIDHSSSNDDLTLYVLNGLGSEFWEIVAPIRARESPLTFEELHDLLVGYEAYLRRLETAMQHLIASANYTKTKPSNYWGSQQWSLKPNDNTRGLIVPAQAETLVVLNVMDVVLILEEPTISIDAINLNAKSVTNLVTLQSLVLSFIHIMYLSIVP